MYKAIALLMLMILSSCGDSESGLRLASTITDHMVIQRGLEFPVYGWAIPGVTVKVEFDGSTSSTKADDSGSWAVRLPAMEAGGPFEMTVTAGDSSFQVSDILVGDVWLASGQSNMEWVVSDANDAQAVIRSASDTQIRHFKVPRDWAYAPEDTLTGGTWEVTSPETVGDFSAVGYFFAQHLRQHVGVPIGILHSSWGGSRIEPWMKAEALGMDGDAQRKIAQDDSARAQELLARLEALVGVVPESDPGLVDSVAVWADPNLDDSDWTTIPVPSSWEMAGYDGMDGVAWYRTTFELKPSEAAEGVTLGVGMIDDSDITWVNGTEVGRMEWSWNKARRYAVPSDLLKSGTNSLTVRVFDGGGGGGIQGAPETLYIESGVKRRTLAGEWKFKVGEISVTLETGKNQIPTLLYNAMVHPLVETPIKGAIWYQGESNANDMENAEQYSSLFKTMITSWREDWDQGDFPFLWVQLANYMATDAEPPQESAWATLRESQSDALVLPATGQAVIIDIGEANDIHPKNKQDVGLRLGLAARHVAYGEDLVYSGPTYKSHEVRGRNIIVSFDHVGSGLKAGSDGRVGGFAIAGADGNFVWADARIGGETVAVSSSRVSDPVAVRYAWGNNPDRANLYNRDGLPAGPFRTDGGE